MSSIILGPTRSWRRRGRPILPEAAMRRAVHAGAGSAHIRGRRQRSSGARPRGHRSRPTRRRLIGARDLRQRRSLRPSEAGWLPHARRPAISLVQSRLFDVRRFPRRSRRKSANPFAANASAPPRLVVKRLRGAEITQRGIGISSSAATRTPVRANGSRPTSTANASRSWANASPIAVSCLSPKTTLVASALIIAFRHR